MSTKISGSTGVDKVQDSIISDSKLNLSANSQEIKDALNATGSAPIYACRAWVNFNGTGTVAIRASGNVSSITDIGTGDYKVNFITAMSNSNYSAVAVTESFNQNICICRNYNVDSFGIAVVWPGVAFYDSSIISGAIFY